MKSLLRLALLLSVFAIGCVGTPFVTPPVRASLTYEAFSEPLPQGDSSAAHFELGAHPLAIARSTHVRQFDPGIGYGLFDSDTAFVHAPYLELQSFLWSYPVGKTALLRTGTAVKQLLLFDDHGRSVGFGGTSQLFIEIGDYVAGNFAGSDNQGGVIGAGGGELSIALHVQTTAMRLDDKSIWAAGLGASVRLPASIGFGWVWLK